MGGAGTGRLSGVAPQAQSDELLRNDKYLQPHDTFPVRGRVRGSPAQRLLPGRIVLEELLDGLKERDSARTSSHVLRKKKNETGSPSSPRAGHSGRGCVMGKRAMILNGFPR